jgi:diguanylate cyclase (GGDEF)-like protein
MAGEGIADDRIRLGVALQARADEVGELVDQRFAEDLYGQAFSTARLATFLIGRWLATDEVASAEDEAVIARQGEQAILENASLASVAKAYLAWRGCTIAVLTEEAHSLGVDDGLLAMACDVVRLSCDGSLVRVVRQFDETRRMLQRHLDEKQRSLTHQALHDQLTGLPNRSLLIDRLERTAASFERSGTGAMLLYLDLDNFKAINDRFGHAAGDCLLVAVADRLQQLTRKSDTVARLGGDEFVILADGLDGPEVAARSLAERIHLSMGAPVVMGDRNLYTSVSIGIAAVSPNDHPEVNLARADAAMYQAKRGGPARSEYYNPSIGENSRRRSHLVHELHSAHRLGQLSIQYQPIFRLRPAVRGIGRGAGALSELSVRPEIVGAEALLRWEHPELGWVSPAEFVPLLERSREIVPVGRWVLEESVAQCRAWKQQSGCDLAVSVNASAFQLQDPSFAVDVQRALTDSGLAPGSLVLEVTESVLVADIHRVGATMQRLRDVGVHVALDDFGTGYSSLRYLRGLPIDRLKVDRSFVTGLGTPEQEPTIISAVVDLAHKLELLVVAEGVETARELECVADIGCDEAQGFLLAKPGPPEAVFEHLPQLQRGSSKRMVSPKAVDPSVTRRLEQPVGRPSCPT